MHHYGGGYADIKLLNFDWNPYFEILDNSDAWAMGYPEVQAMDVAVDPNDQMTNDIRSSYASLIGNCNYIFKPNTPFTREWKKHLHVKLDEKLPELRANPGRHPQEFKNAMFSDGTFSRYPLRWAEILGEIFHRLCYLNRDRILTNLPRFTKVQDYR
jgi:hypothetical protein